jgi:hypothetical protein
MLLSEIVNLSSEDLIITSIYIERIMGTSEENKVNQELKDFEKDLLASKTSLSSMIVDEYKKFAKSYETVQSVNTV